MSRSVLPAEPVVAVVGVTGLVGEVLLSVLEERGFPVRSLLAFAGPRSRGKEVLFRGRAIPVESANPEAFDGVDLVFFAATGELSRELGPAAVERGALVIDKSSTWRMDPAVPLVVPAVNAGALDSDARLLACPNCTTIGLVHALAPLHAEAGLARVVVTTLQSASGAGRAGLEALCEEEAGDTTSRGVFPARLLGNAIPLCDELEESGMSREERKLVQEVRRILGEPALDLAVTATRVPVMVGHAASVWLETERELTLAQAQAALAAFPGVRLTELPTPLEVAGTDEVLIGRLRVKGRTVQLWQVADNLRRGAATNAVEIAERCLA